MIDQSQLESLYNDYAKGLYGYFVSCTHCEADAADLLQDVFVKLARTPRCLDRVANVRSFLFRMAHNMAIDWSRRGKSRRERAEGLTEQTLLRVDADPDTERFRASLENALTELPEEQRSAVYMKLWGGLTAEEIGELSGVSANTISSRYRYGLEKLREVLRPVYDEIKT
jgi:RNA polymerase sigma-70 factor (ECF subfamily)